jgi:hypothetical protein
VGLFSSIPPDDQKSGYEITSVLPLTKNNANRRVPRPYAMVTLGF